MLRGECAGTEDLVEGGDRVAGDCDGTGSRLVKAVKVVDKGNNTQKSSDFAAVRGSQCVAGVRWRSLMGPTDKHDGRVAEVPKQKAGSAQGRFPGAVAYCLEGTVGQAVG